MGEVVVQWVGVGPRVGSGVIGAVMPSRWVLRTQVPQGTPEPICLRVTSTGLRAVPWMIDPQLPTLNNPPPVGS